MNEIVVGVYESRRDADVARDRLIEQGVDGACIALEQGPRAADNDECTRALRDGQCVLSVRTQDAAQTRLALALLARGSPRAYSLPNAPTAWNEASAGDAASIGGIERDPARPEGLLDDAESLPASSDRARLVNAPRTR